MRLHPARLGLLLFALFALACASRQDTRESGWSDDESKGNASGALDNGDEDAACARQVRAARKSHCEEAPPQLPEGYAEKAREPWDRLTQRCAGMRARLALRHFDACIVALEKEPSQMSHEDDERRADAKSKVADLRANPVYQHAFKRKREAVEEADRSSQLYRQAAKDQDEQMLRHRGQAWHAAEQEIEQADQALLELLEQQQISLRDAKALGLF